MRIPIDPGISGFYYDTESASLVTPGIVRLGSIITSTSTAYANVTGLAVPLAANVDYEIEGLIVYQSAVATTGIALSFTDPAGCSTLAHYYFGSAATTLQFRHESADDTNTPTTAVPAINADTLARIHAYVRVGATAGNWQLRLASEIGGDQVSVRPGSFLRYRRVPSS